MSVVMFPSIIDVPLSLNNTSTIAFRRAESKDTVESTMGVAAKKVFMSLPSYENIKLFIDKDIKMIWQQHHNEWNYQQQQKVAYPHVMNGGGTLLTAQRQSKAISSK